MKEHLTEVNKRACQNKHTGEKLEMKLTNVLAWINVQGKSGLRFWYIRKTEMNEIVTHG